MENLLIHIGYHKTATTWLQRELFVDDNNVFLPLSRWKRSKSSFGFKFVVDDDGYILSPFDSNKKAIKKEFLYLTKDKQHLKKKIFVISTERLGGHFMSGGFDSKSIAYRISSTFPKAKILITIREQDSAILSSYLQYLSRGGLFGINKFLNRKSGFQEPTFSPCHFNYKNLVKEYFKIFGKENVLVLPYEIFKENPEHFINKLGKFLDRDIQVDHSRFNVKHNFRKKHFILYNFRFLSKFIFCNSHNYYSAWHYRPLSYMTRFFLKLVSTITPKKLNEMTKKKLAHYIKKWIGGRYKKSNEELSELIGIDLSDYGYHSKK